MSEEFTYSITGDTLNGIVNLEALTIEIQDLALGPDLEGLFVVDDELTVVMSAALSAGEEATLNAAIAAHTGESPPGIVGDEHEIDPTVNDDSTLGFEIQDHWFNVANNKAFVVFDVTEGAAVWKQVTNAGGDHGDLTGLGNDDHTQYSLADGTRDFTGVVVGVDPTLASHLSTKNYVDTEISNEVLGIDHGNLPGLADDDHTQYSLVDGSRAFGGVVSGITPTVGSHLATKDYVDSLVSGLDWQESVLSNSVSVPPGSPSVGDRYIVAATATGVWVGKEEQIAQWNGSSWDFLAPNEGFAAWVEDVNKLCVYNGALWVTLGSTSDHGALSGLGDDDHSQYSLADGSRDFTGVISGITPTLAAHLATKGYIDAEVLAANHGNLSGLGDDDHSQYSLSDGSRDFTGVVVGVTPALAAHLATKSYVDSVGTMDHGNLNGLTDDDHGQYSLADGSRDFTGVIVGVEPTLDAHLATKGYVDTAIPTMDHGLLSGLLDDDHTQYSLADGSRDFTGVVVGVIPTLDAHLTTKGYVDAEVLAADHGNLGGLGDDDHTHYSLADGSRAFSGTVGGITPTIGSHLVTKDYVDSLVEGLDWQESVLSSGLSTPPGSPTTGDRYIVAATGTGDWVGKEDQIAEWNGSSWEFFVPTEGAATWVEDVNKLCVYNGTAWVTLGSTSDHGNLAGLGDNDHTQYQLRSEENVANGYAGLDSGGEISDAVHGGRGGGTLHALVTGATAGFMAAADKTKLDGIPSGATDDHGSLTGLDDDDHTQYQLRSEKDQINGYAGLDGSTEIPDAIHGSRGGGSLHAAATGSVAGFMSATDKTKLDGVDTGAEVDDKDVKVSSNDTTPSYLATKIVAGANVTITELNDGGNETLEIASPGSGGDLTVTTAVATNTVSTTSKVYTPVPDMLITPGAGDYIVWFSASVNHKKGKKKLEFSIFVNGIEILDSHRTYIDKHKEEIEPVSTQAFVTGVGAGQDIEVRWKIEKYEGKFFERSLIVAKV